MRSGIGFSATGTYNDIANTIADKLTRSGNMFGVPDFGYSKMNEPFGFSGQTAKGFFDFAANKGRGSFANSPFDKYSSALNQDTLMGLLNPKSITTAFGKQGKLSPGMAGFLTGLDAVTGFLKGPLGMANMMNPYGAAMSAAGGILDFAGIGLESQPLSKLGKGVQNPLGTVVGGIDELIGAALGSPAGLRSELGLKQKTDITRGLSPEAAFDVRNIGGAPIGPMGRSTFDVAKSNAMIDAAVDTIMNGLGASGALNTIGGLINQTPAMGIVSKGAGLASSLLGALGQPGLSKVAGLASNPISAVPTLAKEVLSYAVNKQARPGGLFAGLQANPQGGFTTPTGGTISPSGVYHAAGSVTSTGDGHVDYSQLFQYLVKNNGYYS